ncbi:DUF4202 domain-containing protein [Echinicola vietnamensis]|uniref:DUF4202 domain-containing protein n=1 Tax=Echinicola vietnamensis (strain DSM 17526 / LMG 23754 / KMM 6221) TaxID=926556 RepID=L0FW83_ECHVK|nr:DUF4202 domain-containing protein [Echinicola vietnamensis]AGA78159.1 hypothetical protein Echvi_1904 [Echinicola vietnamensis DSM 17526]
MAKNRFEKTIASFDAINAEDPHKEVIDGKEVPKELVYGHRMTGMLLDFEPEASETLRLAARCQHIKRWEIPREDYPMDRKGYLLWRTKLKKFHGELAGKLMKEHGYDDDDIQKVDDLLNKRRLKTDPETQALEDVVCLVFLKYYFDDFIAKHRDEEGKLVDIVQKTWRKMSEKGHQAALAMSHSDEALGIVQKALA